MRGLLCVLVVSLSITTPRGWTPTLDERVARESIRLMPVSLRGILETHYHEIVSGILEAAAGEEEPGHRQAPGQRGRTAARTVDEMTTEIVEMIDDQKPFSEVARRMGTLAHFLGDLNNPLNVMKYEGFAHAEEYSRFVESRLEEFPLVFYGWEDRYLSGLEGSKRPVRAYAEAAADRSRRYAAHIVAAYAPDNPVPVARRFDVRSLPFGIGSLCYSRAVTDTAKVWLYIWTQAHGDLDGTPYLEPERTARKEGGKERR